MNYNDTNGNGLLDCGDIWRIYNATKDSGFRLIYIDTGETIIGYFFGSETITWPSEEVEKDYDWILILTIFVIILLIILMAYFPIRKSRAFYNDKNLEKRSGAGPK